PDGTVDTTDWNDTKTVDTIVDLGTLNQGYHLFDWWFLYISDSAWRSAFDQIYVTETSAKKATGDMQVAYQTDSCDTIMYIREYEGTYDTATYMDLSAIDTSVACSLLSSGYYNNIVLFWFNSDNTWRSAALVFHNSAIGELPNPGPYLCRVYIYVEKADGTGLRGGKLYGQLIVEEGYVQYTCRDIWFMSYTKKGVSNSSGRAFVDLIRSKCLTGGGLYQFKILNPWMGERIYITDSVPDSTSYKLKAEEW
ncbi:hypothetical protein KAR91_64355, partial [Candidatus Pacearchaeota archaeon]|nr:hypothetical protein [Candidatus Pacearchaeota archaeon]